MAMTNYEAGKWENALQMLLGLLIDGNRNFQDTAADGLAVEIKKLVSVLSAESYEKMMHDLNRRLFELINSSDITEKLAALNAISKLAEQAPDESMSHFTKYANYIRTILPCKDHSLLISATKTLGHLVKASLGTLLAAELVDFEITRCIEWLEEKKEITSLASMLIIKEFVLAVPSLMYPYILTLMEHSFFVLCNSKSPQLQETALEAYKELLVSYRVRSEPYATQEETKKMVDKAISILNSNPNTYAMSGCIDTLSLFTDIFPELIRSTYFECICDVCLNFLSEKDFTLKEKVFNLTSKIITLNREAFASSFLPHCISILIEILTKEKEKLKVLKFLKSTIETLGGNFQSAASSICDCLRLLLVTNKGRHRFQEEAHIYECISSLAKVLKNNFLPYFKSLVSVLLTRELNIDLRVTLVIIVENIPISMPLIEDYILDSVNKTLRIPPSEISKTNESVFVFACDTISHFHYCGAILTSEVGKRLIALVETVEFLNIRTSAALALAHLIRRYPSKEFYESYSSALNAVTILLTLVSSDSDVNLRVAVLEALNDESIDFFMSSSEPFHILLMILGSGTLSCRLTAVSIVERITRANIGLIFPHFRTILLQLLADLNCSFPLNIAEEAAIVLSELTRLPSSLMKPTVEPLLRALSPMLRDKNPKTATSVLIAMGRLVQVNPGAFNSYTLLLVNSVSDILIDKSSSNRRLAALNFLCTLLRNVERSLLPFERLSDLLLEISELLKIELVRPVRNEAIRLIGIIGALDPYKLRTSELRQQRLVDTSVLEGTEYNSAIEGPVTSSSEDFYHSVVISALLCILKDSSLNKLHHETLQALLEAFQSIGTKSYAYLNDTMAALMKILRSSNDDLVDFALVVLASLLKVIGLHIRPFSSEIVSLLIELWNSTNAGQLNIKSSLLSVIRSLAHANMGETLRILTELTPTVVSVLFWKGESCQQTQDLYVSALLALESLASYSQDYLHSIISALSYLLQREVINNQIVKLSVILIFELSDKFDIRLELPLIMRIIGLMAIWKDGNLRTLSILDKLACYLFVNYSEDITPLCKDSRLSKLPTFQSFITGSHSSYDLSDDSISYYSLRHLDWDREINDSTLSFPSRSVHSNSKHPINEQSIKRCWNSQDCINKEEWFYWIRKLETELLKESPSACLRACANLASIHYPLARELFNAAFISCWNDLDDQSQDELVGSLEMALSSSSIPPEVMQIILNLVEFMERDDHALPIDTSTLGAYSMKCHAFAKALYYQEAEFQNAPSTASVEALISVNSQIQQPDSAVGVLICAQKHFGIHLEESWYEKLQQWDDALTAYRSRWEQDPQSFDALLGIFRCWHALGEWDALNTLATDVLSEVPTSVQSSLIPLAASAAWSTGSWERMTEFVDLQPENSLDGTVFRAVLAINKRAYEEAQRNITLTRELLDAELTAMISESYNRAYNTIVRAQTLSELEEVILYCQAGDNIQRRENIKSCWDSRLDDCQLGVDVWQRILKIRSLVLAPEESPERWIKFASLCRANSRPIISRRILLSLLHAEDKNIEALDLTLSPPLAVYGFLKHIWEADDKELAIKYMKQYTQYLANTLERSMGQLQLNGSSFQGEKNIKELDAKSHLLARCYCKLGEWQKSVLIENDKEINSSILENYLAATSYDKNWYKAWHGWALMNFELAMNYERQSSLQFVKSRPLKMMKNPYLVPAIQGFFRSIGLSQGNSLQDSLRLLTLWFKYGSMADVNAAVGDGFQTIPVDNWLQVIPQLIARIHVPSPQIRRLIHQLLTDIGRQHPQALIYPLTVASKSQSVSRRSSALAILDKMRSHSSRLVEQAIMVSQELIRIAILWEELWYEGLEEASKMYFGEKNINSMLSILEPLHQMIENGHETMRERTFLELYGGDLKEAREHCQRYKRTGDIADINSAWDLYYQVFRRISKQLPQLGAIDLASVSPKLLSAENLDIAVPGTYKADQEVAKIRSFNPTIWVISSKQRPRKLVLTGSDGQRYKYLLKGHEDLRQDQRVMQLFELVNTVLNLDPETRKRHLSIERFSVVPLSQNTGLIGWVPNCDTIHSLIRDYRESRGILLSIEHRLMVQFAPDYDHLPTINKVEVFEYGQNNTDGRDLGRIMWQRSMNSEVWLERRLVYTRSLAVMSMVGYILGLGDRHPSNLMIDQVSGRVVHIDFGDCFEVAMQREKFPEKVPFRLTRMLVKAMEVSGIEGSFRITCEHTMRVLRINKDSLMAVLEAFVYDPLINWRLLAQAEPTKASNVRPSSSGYSEVASDDGHFPENFSSSRRVRRDSEISRLEDESINRPEVVNAGALNVINRVSSKLTGRDFSATLNLDVPYQIEKLISEAVNVENLCQAYIGWCAFW